MGAATDWLEATFPRLRLRVPLFGAWPVGLRFSLGGPMGWSGPDEAASMAEVHNRAVTLFEACFARADEGFLFVQLEAPDGVRVDPAGIPRATIAALRAGWSELRPYLPDGSMPVEKSVGSNLHGDLLERYGQLLGADAVSNEAIPYQQAAFVIRPRHLAYRALLAATANRETSARPRIFSQLFFANATRPLLLNIYDDRGLDVVATDARWAQALALAHQSWLSAWLPSTLLPARTGS